MERSAFRGCSGVGPERWCAGSGAGRGFLIRRAEPSFGRRLRRSDRSVRQRFVHSERRTKSGAAERGSGAGRRPGFEHSRQPRVRRCASSLHREQPQRAVGLRGGQGPLSLAFGRGSSAARGALPQAGFARPPAPQPHFSVRDRRRRTSVSVWLAASLGARAAAGPCGFRCGRLASGGSRGSGARW